MHPGSYTMVVKEGLDGSGRHVICMYNQLGNVETHNTIIWTLITMGKENNKLLTKIVPPVM